MVGDELKVVAWFCYLRNVSSAGGDCELAIDEISLFTSRDHLASACEKWVARVTQCCCFILDRVLKREYMLIS